ncbi:TIM barrel protein [Methanoculleus sp. FWC-SCC1]|uniref:TIM barrel protein n=1 Tax=Methanoculleus frigidifontis TaxID=2584085 RepID=A0ABT8ME38_9EURY|nr:TIM barrel protein [Methanoculleus sp. FWC-SCC1]
MRQYRIGCAVRSDDEDTFCALDGLHADGRIDHVQVQIIPEPEPVFQRRLDSLAAAAAPIVIHAPHHAHGVNPCAPALCDGFAPEEIASHVEQAMHQTTEAADTLDSAIIVLHAGRFTDEEERQDAAEAFAGFLDRYHDPRLTLENLPAVHAGYPFLGSTADELAALGDGRIGGYCLDFAHLYCTVNYRHLTYTDELRRFEDLNVRHQHISNSIRGSVTDQHLELDHPEGGLDFAAVFGRIAAHPSVETTLEYKRDSYGIYPRQLAVFDGLYRRYGK